MKHWKTVQSLPERVMSRWAVLCVGCCSHAAAGSANTAAVRQVFCIRETLDSSWFSALFCSFLREIFRRELFSVGRVVFPAIPHYSLIIPDITEKFSTTDAHGLTLMASGFWDYLEVFGAICNRKV